MRSTGDENSTYRNFDLCGGQPSKASQNGNGAGTVANALKLPHGSKAGCRFTVVLGSERLCYPAAQVLKLRCFEMLSFHAQTCARRAALRKHAVVAADGSQGTFTPNAGEFSRVIPFQMAQRIRSFLILVAAGL